jgi:trimethylamine:corrinoid methyltransferase-like protein
MRPRLRFLDDTLIDRIVSEACEVLENTGIEIKNQNVIDLLCDNGARYVSATSRLFYTRALIERALKSTPSSFQLFDQSGNLTHDFTGDAVHFTPGSSATAILDSDSGEARPPTTADYISYTKLTSRLPNLHAQSTAFIPFDVPVEIQDSYRLFLSLLYCEKPVDTGVFVSGSFELMREMLTIIRGSKEALAAKPLSIFSCCSIAPLRWSNDTSDNLLDCAALSIPVEHISMPLIGFTGPVTLTGSLIQHTAENLSGIVMSQLANPGCPVLYGGSPAPFDYRHETTPMGAVESQMISCAYAEIGKRLGIPTQAYICLSDAKQIDAQAGLESAMGATQAALAGINSISGPGMHDFENCVSPEKLVLDNEIAGMALRMIDGIEVKDDFPLLPRLEEMREDGHLLIADHTRRYVREEHYFPGPVIDRASRSRWLAGGSESLLVRARLEVGQRIASWEPTSLAADQRRALVSLMEHAATACGLKTLPSRLD